MKKFIALLLFCSLGLASVSNADDSEVIIVPSQYDTIDDALKAIIDGKTSLREIVVEAGTYDINVTLPSNITLRGRETARTILTAANKENATITIDGVTNVTVANFTFVDSNYGILVNNDSTSVFIQNNVFYLQNNSSPDQLLTLFHAIQLSDNSAVSINNNTFYKNAFAIDGINTALSGLNNIFAGNQKVTADGIADLNFNYSCVYDNGNETDNVFGLNSVAGDPLFVNPNTDGKGNIYDFHLKEESPCIDKGEEGDTAIKDEWDQTRADIGAYGGKNKDTYLYPITVSVGSPSDLGNGSYSVALNWSDNTSYHVTHTTNPGHYVVYYDTQPILPFSTDKSPTTRDVGQETQLTIDDLTTGASTLAAPVLTGTSAYNRTIDVSWTAVDGATGYRVYYGTNEVDTNYIDTDLKTSTTLSNLDNGSTYQIAVAALRTTEYYFYVTAVDSTGKLTNYYNTSQEKTLTLGTATIGDRSNTKTAIPEMVEAVPALPNEGCFIATAAFGYYDASEVQILREFRDRVLKRYDSGNAFIAWYYRHGPRAARWLNQHDRFKPVVRLALWPTIHYADFVLSHSAFASGFFTLSVFLSFVLLTKFCWIFIRRNKKYEVRT